VPLTRALNPNGWIPVLLYGDQSMYECAAITIFLCDRHPQAALAPAPDSPLRGLYLQTLVYFSSSVQTAFQLSYYPQRFADSAAHEVGAQKRANSRLYEVWQIVDQQIGDNDWLLGERFSAADIYLFMLVTWLKTERGHPGVEQFPNVNRIARAVAQRPAVKTVYRDWLAMQG